MRGAVAKRIRREIYGDQSIRQKRRYVMETVMKLVRQFVGKDKEGTDKKGFKDVTIKRGIIKNMGRRQEYLDAKKDYKRGIK